MHEKLTKYLRKRSRRLWRLAERIEMVSCNYVDPEALRAYGRAAECAELADKIEGGRWGRS